jgi:hypothetical protein
MLVDKKPGIYSLRILIENVKDVFRIEIGILGELLG